MTQPDWSDLPSDLAAALENAWSALEAQPRGGAPALAARDLAGARSEGR